MTEPAHGLGADHREDSDDGVEQSEPALAAQPTASAQHVEVRRGMYRDSVALMEASRLVGAVEGVTAALVAMATDLNLKLLSDLGFEPPPGAAANDMVVALAADDQMALARARAALESALTTPAGRHSDAAPGEPAPRIIASAARRTAATIALVSVPGKYALGEAMDALEAGLPVMVFSDNVPVEHEVRLKEEAAGRGLLMMGPDCGTAIIGGVGLGFANVVPSGPVGIVAASGTGAQQLSCLLAVAGVGISQCIGGGRRVVEDEVDRTAV